MEETLSVFENDTYVASVSVSDADGDSLSITISGEDSLSFVVEGNILRFKEAPDYEIKKQYFLSLTASDLYLQDRIDIAISILNIHDNSPKILTKNHLFVSHHTRKVVELDAEDVDGDSLEFYIKGDNENNFEIRKPSNELYFIEDPDFKVYDQYEVTLAVNDGLNETIQTVKISERLLPQIMINTYGSSIQDEPKVFGRIDIYDKAEILESHHIGIEIRGSSSQTYPKKSYGFETRDDYNEDVSVSLLGLPEEEDWILYGPYVDRTHIRNVFTYELSNSIGRYASKHKFAELTINESPLGTYILMEKLKRDSSRIDIKKNKSDNIPGGYILKIDKPTGDGASYDTLNSFRSKFLSSEDELGKPIHFLYSYPKAEDISEDQKLYIQDYIDTFERALRSDDFADSDIGYRAFIDTASFIDYFLLTELSHNVDGYRISTYLHKDRDGLLVMGPVWDYNLAYGNVATRCNPINEWAYLFRKSCPNDLNQVPFWWSRLLEDREYVASLKLRWLELRDNEFSISSINSRLDSYSQFLNDHNSMARNHNLWGASNSLEDLSGDEDYRNELGRLKIWIEARLLWLDAAISDL